MAGDDEEINSGGVEGTTSLGAPCPDPSDGLKFRSWGEQRPMRSGGKGAAIAGRPSARPSGQIQETTAQRRQPCAPPGGRARKDTYHRLSGGLPPNTQHPSSTQTSRPGQKRSLTLN